MEQQQPTVASPSLEEQQRQAKQQLMSIGDIKDPRSVDAATTYVNIFKPIAIQELNAASSLGKKAYWTQRLEYINKLENFKLWKTASDFFGAKNGLVELDGMLTAPTQDINTKFTQFAKEQTDKIQAEASEIERTHLKPIRDLNAEQTQIETKLKELESNKDRTSEMVKAVVIPFTKVPEKPVFKLSITEPYFAAPLRYVDNQEEYNKIVAEVGKLQILYKSQCDKLSKDFEGLAGEYSKLHLSNSNLHASLQISGMKAPLSTPRKFNFYLVIVLALCVLTVLLFVLVPTTKGKLIGGWIAMASTIACVAMMIKAKKL